MRDLLYGQSTIKGEFQSGERFADFICQLRSGDLNPCVARHPFPLRACRYKGSLSQDLNAFSDVLQKLLDLFPGEAQIADAAFARRK